jgi:hypothetical protein
MQFNAQSYSIIDISQSIRVESRLNNSGAVVLQEQYCVSL